MKKDIIILILVVGHIQNIIAQVGKVGINTTSPAAMLHVKDSSVVFTGPSILPEDPGPTPLSGSGTRMMWYADKAAFRAGTVSSTQWDETSVGSYSFAAGLDAKASGKYSTALGRYTTASGTTSTAMGEFSVASGNESVALGYQTEASGLTSFSMGFLTNSVGNYSSAFGNNTDANAYASFVIGRYNDPTYISATSWNQADPLFIIGNGSSSGIRSNALTVLKNARTGINTASPLAMLHVNDGSVVFANSSNQSLVNPPISGTGTRMMWYHSKSALRAGNVDGDQWDRDSIGYYSIGLGKNVKAKGYISTAFGSGNAAHGEASTAFGLETIAYGTASTSLGWASVASGDRSLAAGHFTKAKGGNSFSTGVTTVANGYGSTVVGMFNDSIISAQTSGSTATTPLFIVGNGSTHNARSNAITILKNGNIGITTSSPEFKLDVAGRMRIRHTGDGSPGTWYNNSDNSAAVSFIGMYNDSHVGIYSGLGASWNFLMNLYNGNTGIGITPTQKLHVSGNGLFTGTVTASCGVLTCSDIRYKTNIQPLTNSLNNILALQGIRYDWNTQKFPEKSFSNGSQIGFSAQELEKIYPEMVHTDEDGYKTVDYTRLTPVLVEAMKEQQSQIESLKNELHELKEMILSVNGKEESVFRN